jgi:hypothetical protein
MTTPTPTPPNGASAPPNGAAAAAPVAQEQQQPNPPTTTTTSLLPESVLRAIRGEATTEEKRQAYDRGLQRWWGEYAARKNDEEEEHVADSLMYDERLHLPRTTRRPDVCD